MVDNEWSEFRTAVLAAREFNNKTLHHLSGSKRHRTPGFGLVWRLKGHSLLQGKDRYEAGDLVDQVFVEEFGIDHCEWQKVIDDNSRDGEFIHPYDDFLDCWDACHSPGTSVAEEAVKDAEENPRPSDYFGARFSQKHRGSYRFFLTIAENLQVIQGDEPILLPEALLADLTGFSKQQISKWRKLAVKDGFLVKVKDHVPHHASTEFKFQIPEEYFLTRTVDPETQNLRAPDKHEP